MLQGSEKHWHISEQELEALCENSRKWSKILMMNAFIHVTDHENLLDILNWSKKINNKNHNHRLHRQLFCLAEFDFVVLYKPGCSWLLITPDYLSRCIDHERVQGRIKASDDSYNDYCPEQQHELKDDFEYFDNFNKKHFNEFIKKVDIKETATNKRIKEFSTFKSILNGEQPFANLNNHNMNICLLRSFNTPTHKRHILPFQQRDPTPIISAVSTKPNNKFVTLKDIIKNHPELDKIDKQQRGKKIQLTDNQKLEIARYKLKAKRINEYIKPTLNRLNQQIKPKDFDHIVIENQWKMKESMAESNKFLAETGNEPRDADEKETGSSIVAALNLKPTECSLLFASESHAICAVTGTTYLDDISSSDEIEDDDDEEYTTKEYLQLSQLKDQYPDNQRYIDKDGILREILNSKLLNVKLLTKAQRNDPTWTVIIRYLTEHNDVYLNLLPEIARSAALSGQFKLRGDGLLVNSSDRIIIPSSLVPTIIHAFHSDAYHQHQSEKRIEHIIKARFYWSSISRDLKKL